MTSEHIFRVDSKNSKQTEALAFQLGELLRGGEIIELIGDVGVGKTTFVRGLARGIGSRDRVTSPTFTVSKVYEGSQINLHHYDFYRLEDFKVIKKELEEVLSHDAASVILEWAGGVDEVLPDEHVKVQLEVKSENSRILRFVIPEKFAYLRLEDDFSDKN